MNSRIRASLALLALSAIGCQAGSSGDSSAGIGRHGEADNAIQALEASGPRSALGHAGAGPDFGATTDRGSGVSAAGAAPKMLPEGPPAPDAAPPRAKPLEYPVTPTGSQIDDYHGVKVADPYRWLEDPDSPQTRAWVESQNRLTFSFLEGIPERAAIRERLTTLWNYERFGLPQRRGGRYFFTRNDGLQNQSVLCAVETLSGKPRVLLDPNTLSTDGTVALTDHEVSEDGRLLAYGLSTSGSDWEEWRVRDVETGRDLSDHLKWVKFSGASWTRDSKGFFYSGYDEPLAGRELQQVNFFQKLYYHVIGTPQSDDRLVCHRPDQKEWSFHGSVTDDGRYLIIAVEQGTDPRNRVFYKGLGNPDAPVVELLGAFDASYTFLDNDGPVFWFRTDLNAPRGRIIAVDTTRPEREHWKEVLPQDEDTLVAASVVNDAFFTIYLKHASSRIRLFSLEGRPLRELTLPGLGTVSGFSGRRTDTETFFAFTSYVTPPTIFRYECKAAETTLFRRPAVDFDPAAYETRQVFCSSRDGTRVPMFVSHRKDISKDGQNPTVLYGYGGFGIPVTPSFSVAPLLWMEMGGVYAVANLRGGGEYGEDWHQAGKKQRKQRVFDDFITAAEWLVRNRYTSSDKLAIHGGSNGGLLVGACMTQRPDLFGAALPAVGVLDMLRFHRFTIGWAWTPEYGSADDPQDFKALLAYSPIHNVRPATRYPATLITTADHDDRVVPAHSYKFAAALQAAQDAPAPILIRIETRAGHGAGKPTAKMIDEAADRTAFLVKALGVRPPERE